MAFRNLTDHEYKINATSWIGCTSENTIDNEDGSFTINVGDIAIPIGGLQVRVKAIGINPPSMTLTNSVAFTSGSITFRFPYTSFFVNTMALGDADQLLTYQSDSDGVGVFTSSNPSIASIIFTGGNYFLHPVSEGTVDVIFVQEPDGDYNGITLESKGTIVTATTITDTTYGNITNGLTATSDGSYFNIPDQNSLVLRKYQVVSAKALYVSSLPNTTLKTAKRVKELIYDESLGVMPSSPIVDADSIYGAYNPNTLKNIGNTTAIPFTLLKYRFKPFFILGGNSSAFATKISDTEQRADYFSQTGEAFAAFLMLTGGNKTIPPGTWFLTVELKIPEGEGSRPYYFGRNLDSPTGASYQEIIVTEEYTAFSFAVINYTEFTQEGYPWVISCARTGTHDSSTLYLRNWRFVAGTADTGVVSYYDDLILSRAEDSIHKAFTSNLDFRIMDLTQTGNDNIPPNNSFAHIEDSDFELVPLSIMWGVKITPSNDNGQFTVMFYNVETESDFILIQGDGTFYNTNEHWFAKAFLNERAFNYRENTWYILTMTSDGTNNSIYVNGQLINRKISATGNLSLSRLDFFGGQDVFNGFANISGVTLWHSCLSEDDVREAAIIMSERMRLKNHHLKETHDFYLAEGDSITWLTNSYQKLLRQQYTPNIQGALLARDGAKLGSLGDNPADDNNTVHARKARTENMITSAVSNGKHVIYSILIGANDISTLTSSELVIDYYDKLMDYIADIRALGVKVIASTIMDCPPNYVSNPDGRERLEQLNSLIASDTSKYDGLADYFNDPAFNTASYTYLYDLVHPNSTGYAVMKDIIEPIFESFRI